MESSSRTRTRTAKDDDDDKGQKKKEEGKGVSSSKRLSSIKSTLLMRGGKEEEEESGEQKFDTGVEPFPSSPPKNLDDDNDNVSFCDRNNCGVVCRYSEDENDDDEDEDLNSPFLPELRHKEEREAAKRKKKNRARRRKRSESGAAAADGNMKKSKSIQTLYSDWRSEIIQEAAKSPSPPFPLSYHLLLLLLFAAARWDKKIKALRGRGEGRAGGRDSLATRERAMHTRPSKQDITSPREEKKGRPVGTRYDFKV